MKYSYAIIMVLVFSMQAYASKPKTTFNPPNEPAPKETISGASRFTDTPNFEPPPNSPMPQCRKVKCKRGGI